MQDHDTPDTWTAERVVVLQLLRDDHDPRWTRPELEAEIGDLSQQVIVAALAYLAIEEVIDLDETAVWASRCARHMDRLDLVSV